MAKKLKILVVTYYWPPDTGGGVQRILKFCKYLKDFGHDPVVITRGSGPQAQGDPSFREDTEGIRVVRVPFRLDPVKLVNRGHAKQTGSGRRDRSGLYKRISGYLQRFVWLNLFIPDAKIGWYRPVIKKVDALLRTESFDAVITSGPPYTVHLIGLATKKKFGRPWLLDVRDPWLENPPYNLAYRFSLVRALNAYLERRVLESADSVVTIGEVVAGLLQTKTALKKIDVIYNGFDEDNLSKAGRKSTPYFRLGYYGNIDHHRLPYQFLKRLAQGLDGNLEFARNFKLEIYGDLSREMKTVLRSLLPDGNLSLYDHIPHAKLREEYRFEQVFLLLINNFKYNRHILTGKLFEYLYSGWPILGIGPPGGEAAKILNQTDAGQMFIYDDVERSVQWLMEMFARWQAGKLANRPVADPRFNRREQAKKLIALLGNLTGSGGTSSGQ